MQEDQPQQQKHKLATWLDQLQQESWQLELLISGFAIFLLIGAYQPVHALEAQFELLSLQNSYYRILIGPFHGLLAAYYILSLSLLLHVVLRGLWISTVGLRYVSGDIDYEALRLNDTYKGWLHQRIGSFDRYIERLEQVCSVWFSYTFLIVFCILGSMCFLLFMIFLQFTIRVILDIDLLYGSPGAYVDQIVIISFFIFGLIYAFDFLTLGLLKRNKIIGKIYYPIYRLMGWVTLAALYRPLYYNLIDNRFGRRIAYMLVPIILFTLVIMSVYVVNDPFLPYGEYKNSLQDNGEWFYNQYYEDQGEEVNLYLPSVSTAFPEKSFLPVFIPYVPDPQDESLLALCPDLQPARYAGIKLRGGISAGEIVNTNVNGDSLLLCFREMYRFQIDDSVHVNVPLRFTYHEQRQQHGLSGVVDIGSLAHGEHALIIQRQRLRSDRLQWVDWPAIYFWKE